MFGCARVVLVNDRSGLERRTLRAVVSPKGTSPGRCFSVDLLSNDALDVSPVHPHRVSSAVFAVLRERHLSKAVTSNAAPKTAGQFAPSVRLRCKRRGHLPFRRQERPPTDPCAGNTHPEEFPALKTASIGLRRRELRPQTRSRIVPWPPSRQGYFAPASRDAILLDGSLPATNATLIFQC